MPETVIVPSLGEPIHTGRRETQGAHNRKPMAIAAASQNSDYLENTAGSYTHFGRARARKGKKLSPCASQCRAIKSAQNPRSIRLRSAPAVVRTGTGSPPVIQSRNWG